MRHTILFRGCLLATGVLFLAGAAQAWAQPQPEHWPQDRVRPESRQALRLAIIDRDTGRELQQYHHGGQLYVAGRPGARYSIRLLNNRRAERLLAVVAVDGVNVVSGKTASYSDTGYVLQPGSRQDITGWRKSDHEVAAFEFASIADSYASRTGRPDNVGVIGVAVFHEVQRIEPTVDYRTFNVPSTPSASRMESHKAAPAGGAGLHAQDSLGTGHGARERSEVTKTTFDRATRHPTQVLTVRYDTFENLMVAGIIPKRRPYTPGPNPFPRSVEPGYVPDPPAR